MTLAPRMFAAFPHWYASLFAGFYLPLLLILVGLIIGALGLEYRGKGDTDAWRRGWDVAIIVGSFLPALLWGVAFANIVNGMPLDDRTMEYTANLFTLLNPLTLLGGLTTLGLFLTHGALFAALRATRAGRDGWGFTGTFVCIALVVATLFTALFPDVLPNSNPGQFGLSVTNASSSECTLRIMTGAAVVFMPIVLAYQAWSYWVFRRRLTKEHIPAAAHY